MNLSLLLLSAGSIVTRFRRPVKTNFSVATVFNYFPTKEDLVYSRMEAFEAELIEAIREREPGKTVIAAFSRFVLEVRGYLASKDPDAGERLAAIANIITGSPALLAREREIFARYTLSLAALIAEKRGRLPTTSHPGSSPTRS